jgi:hypothetical protein
MSKTLPSVSTSSSPPTMDLSESSRFSSRSTSSSPPTMDLSESSTFPSLSRPPTMDLAVNNVFSDFSFPFLWILEISWNIELDFSVSVFEFRQLSYLFANATRMRPEDRSLFVETSLSPFYAKILVEKLLQGFLKSLGDDEDSSSVPCTIEPPPLTAEDFKRQEDHGIDSISSEPLGLGSRLSSPADNGVSSRPSPVVDRVIALDDDHGIDSISSEPPSFKKRIQAMMLLDATRVSRGLPVKMVHCSSVFYDQSLSDQGRMAVNQLLMSRLSIDSIPSKPPELSSPLSTLIEDRVIHDDHGINLIPSQPLLGLGSRLSPSIDTHGIADDHGIDSIPSMPPELSSPLSTLIEDRVIHDDHGINPSQPLLALGSRLSPSIDNRAIDDDHGINLIPSKPPELSSPLSTLIEDRVIHDDHGIYLIPSQPLLALGSRLSPSIDTRVIDDDHGINSIPSKPPELSSPLSTLIEDHFIGNKNDDHGINLISIKPPGLGSRLSTVTDNRVVNDDHGINLIPSKPHGLGSPLSTLIEDRFIVITNDDHGISLIPSKPPGLSSRLTLPVDNPAGSIAHDDHLMTENLIPSEPLGRGSRLLTSFDDRVAINDDHGIDLIPSKPPGLGSPLSTLIEDHFIGIKNDDPKINLILSQSLGRGSRLFTSFDERVTIKDDRGIYLIPRQPLLGLGSPLSTLIEDRDIVIKNDDQGINLIPSKPPGLGSRLSRPVDNCCVSIALDDLEPFGLSSCPSPVVDRVIALDDDHGIDSISSKPLGLGSRVPCPADNCISIALDDLEPLARVTGDHGIDSIEDRVIALDDDHGIDSISSKPLGLGSRPSTVTDNRVIDDDHGINLIPSQHLLGLGSPLSTLIEDRDIVIKNADQGINLIPSKPPGLGSRLSTVADSAILNEPLLGLSPRLSPSIDTRVIDNDHGINLIPSKPPELSSPLSTLIEDRFTTITNDDHGISLIPSKPPGLGSHLFLSLLRHTYLRLICFLCSLSFVHDLISDISDQGRVSVNPVHSHSQSRLVLLHSLVTGS